MIAIHCREGSYSDKWIEYCEMNNLEYCMINIFDSEIISTIRKKGITYVLFHLDTIDYKVDLIVKKLVPILEREGVKIFPNFNSFEHYNDKLLQKYLFEKENLSHAKMYAFFSKKDALEWVKKASYPFVFKLRNGAGGSNVKLIQNIDQAEKQVDIMFGKGVKPIRSIFNDLEHKIKYHNQKRDWIKVFKKMPLYMQTYFQHQKHNQEMPTERGYFLAQDFIPNLECDYRMKVVGDICWGLKRHVRENDFRASGSRYKDFNKQNIPKELVRLSFEYAQKLNMQSVAFDFVMSDDDYKLLECSYCYVINDDALNGYWNRDLEFIDDDFRPEYLMIENLIAG